MILRRLKLTGLKKFTKAEFTFGPSINLFLGPNEAGKSTIQQAIFTALYGVRSARSAGLLLSKDAARSWQLSSECLVELEYELAGESYLLVRDLISGKPVLSRRVDEQWQAVSEDNDDVARRIAQQTGIDNAYVFGRTISVSQDDIAQVSDLKEVGDNIELVFTGEACVGPEDARDYIDKQFRKALRKRGNENPGRLDKLERHLEELSEQIVQAREQEQERSKFAARLEELNELLPGKKDEFDRVSHFREKARKRTEVLEKYRRADRDFNAVDRRLEQVRKAQVELGQLDEQRRRMGPVGDMDPEQVLSRLREIDTKLAQVCSRAEQVARELATEEKRLDSALDALKELQGIEAGIDGLKPLDKDNLEEAEQLRTETSERFRKCESTVSGFEERETEMISRIEVLDEVLARHNGLGDADEALGRWREHLTHRTEGKVRVETAEAELAAHSEREPGSGMHWLVLMVSGTILGLAAFVAAMRVWPGPLNIAGVLLCVAGLFSSFRLLLAHMATREWRHLYQHLADAVKQMRDALGRVEIEMDDFARTIGTDAGGVEAALLEYRDARHEKERIEADLKYYRSQRRDAEERLLGVQHECVQLAARFGCQNVSELRERCVQLRKHKDARDSLRRNILAIFGAASTRDPMGVVEEASANIEKLGSEKKELQTELTHQEERRSDLLQRTDCQDTAELTRRAEALRDLIAKNKTALTVLEKMLSGKSVAELAEEREARKTELAELSGRLDEQFASFEPTVEDIEKWEIQYAKLSQEVEALREERDRIDGRLRSLTERPGPSLAELEGEKEYVLEEIRRGDQTVEAALLAMDVLDSIRESHHAQYLPALEKAAGSLFAKVTGGRYRGVILVDSWPAVSVSQNGIDVIDPGQLSRGTSDQLYFALRLASAEALSQRTELPLILDDPFVNFDPKRMAQAMDLLKRVASQSRQVILFTHDPRQAMFENSWAAAGLRTNHVDL